ncbi:hypothetical protein AbraIFM66951_004427 [Aspergillus brasiliensis]|uniref:EGF domain-specific O-linked N-acetylglucosamine transferase n=1 Tax=Aspergillus brasiliensis TaxID=319629 RepID=A0A9W6DQV0_9EURO|nr:hypothetical protein AbraCBS73388_002194 [Aspergillus brasiliensis]GKZ43330.1 hypothetical protein AbraIFM66951_004427 [Aspergillus brasiliensis]
MNNVHMLSRSQRRFLRTCAILLAFLAIISLLYTTSILHASNASSVTLFSPHTTPCAQDSSPGLPRDYSHAPEQPPLCANLFGTPYLESLRDHATEYCTPDSPTSLTCFHTQTIPGDRIDTFCIARGAVFDSTQAKYILPCTLRDIPRSSGIPSLREFHDYWYGTGAGIVIHNAIRIVPPHKSTLNLNITIPPHTIQNYTILTKREGGQNYWHSLMEIFSMTLSLDVLQMTPTPDTNPSIPLFAPSSIPNTGITLLDTADPGPFIDLWSLFAHKPIRRLPQPSTTTTTTEEDTTTPTNLIIPLPGASNPLWHGDWTILPCISSSLLKTFTTRILSFYDLLPGNYHQTPEGKADKEDPNSITITFINRTTTRRLLDAESLLTSLSTTLLHSSSNPHNTNPEKINFHIQSIDFASLPLREQIRVVRSTDILVGVHGAGLTHAMFLRSGMSAAAAAVVEVLPRGLEHKGFRNLAGLVGVGYFSLHGDVDDSQRRESRRRGMRRRKEEEDGDDWHEMDVRVEEDRFVRAVMVAVGSLSNRGGRSWDVS